MSKAKTTPRIKKEPSDTPTVIIGETPRPASKVASRSKKDSSKLTDDETIVLSEKLG